MVLEILTDRNRLRKKALPVIKIEPKIVTLINHMAQTLDSVRGYGLSAPQVGIPLRIIVIDDGSEVLKLINPVLLDSEGSQHKREGCLSLPHIYGRVERPEKITISAVNDKGKNMILEAEGFAARVICHEIDHLDGILLIDRLPQRVSIERKRKKISEKHIF